MIDLNKLYIYSCNTGLTISVKTVALTVEHSFLICPKKMV